MDAASDAAFSWASICRAIPTSARARHGASFMPSPTLMKQGILEQHHFYHGNRFLRVHSRLFRDRVFDSHEKG